MNKISCIITGFFDSYSDLGRISCNFARQVIALKENDWDIKLVVAQGMHIAGALNDINLKSRIVTEMSSYPDIWFQIGEPADFVNYGKLMNVGICVANESDVISKVTIDGLNRMDLILTTSIYAKHIIEGTKIETKDQTGRVVSTDMCMRPIEVISVGHSKEMIDTKSPLALAQVSESSCFLNVSDWSDFDTDNVALLVYSFISTFKGKHNAPGLILYTSTSVPSTLDVSEISKRIADIRNVIGDISTQPSIYLINGVLNDGTLKRLYNSNKVKAMINVSRSVRTGLALREFALTNKPIIAPDKGAHIGFINCIHYVRTNLIKISPKQYNPIMVPESGQHMPDFVDAARAMVQFTDGKLHPPQLISKWPDEINNIQTVLNKYIKIMNKATYKPISEAFEL